MPKLSRRQLEILAFLKQNYQQFSVPPSLDELCQVLNLSSRGSLHRHIQLLITAGYIEPFNGSRGSGIRLSEHAFPAGSASSDALPFAGVIAAGKPIEAVEDVQYMVVPEELKTQYPCFVLQIKGDSMIEAGILDGDWVVIEKRNYASNGEVVVALVNDQEATLKYIDQKPDQVLLIPANATMDTLIYRPEQVQIQGVLVGQMRRFKN